MKITKPIRAAIKEYYEYSGETNVGVKKVVSCKNGIEDIVVHFIDQHGNKLTSLVNCTVWADGRIDVTEMYTTPRQFEDTLIAEFENSKHGNLNEDEEEYEEDDDYDTQD